MSFLNLHGRMLTSLVLISCWFHSPEAARILMIPANINSHIMYFSQLGEGLASLGHKVELLHPANVIMPSLEVQNQNYTLTSYGVSTEVPFFNRREASETLLEIALTGSSWTRFFLFEKFVKKYDEAYDMDCIDLLENKQLMDRIRRSEFQFAIMDPIIATECYFMVPLILGIPYGAFSINAMPTGSFRVPRLPSFVNFVGTGYSDEMDFPSEAHQLIHGAHPESDLLEQIRGGSLREQISPKRHGDDLPRNLAECQPVVLSGRRRTRLSKAEHAEHSQRGRHNGR